MGSDLIRYLTDLWGDEKIARAATESLPSFCYGCGGPYRVHRCRVGGHDTRTGRPEYVYVKLRCPRFGGWRHWLFPGWGCFEREDMVDRGMGVLRAYGVDAALGDMLAPTVTEGE